MSLLHSLGWVALIAAAVMTLGWLWQRRRENAGLVDVLWSACVGGSAILLAVLGDGAWQARTTLAVLGGLWGARLALHASRSLTILRRATKTFGRTERSTPSSSPAMMIGRLRISCEFKA